jgi:hypothetical protein
VKVKQACIDEKAQIIAAKHRIIRLDALSPCGSELAREIGVSFNNDVD